MNNNLLSIAKILNFHGIKGEAKLGFTKGREKQISDEREKIKKNEVKTSFFQKKLIIPFSCVSEQGLVQNCHRLQKM